METNKHNFLSNRQIAKEGEVLRKSFYVATCILFWGITAAQLFSQTTSQIEQSRRFSIDPTLRDDGEETEIDFGEEAPSTPGDDDLGIQSILSRQEKIKSFAIFGNLAGYYTDNVFLTRNSTIEDTFITGEVGASYRPRFSNRFFGDVTFKQQFFRYSDNEVLDFDGQNASAGLTYLVPFLWDAAFFGRYGYTRLLRANDLVDGDSGTEFYKNHSLSLGFQRVFPFSKAHFMYAGFSSELGFTEWNEPVIADPERDEYALFAGYQANITRSLAAQLFYRIAYVSYSNQVEREDISQIASFGLTYHLADWCSITGTTSLNFNNSNRPIIGDYSTTTGGGSLALDYRF